MAEFINSPIFIAILTSIFTIIGTLLKSLWSTLEKADERLKNLEIATNDLSNVKSSIAGIGQRTGELESQSLLHSSNHNQMSEIIKEIRTEAKETSQILSDLYAKVNQISVAIAILTERSTHNDKTQ